MSEAMRATPAAPTTGPTSFSTSRRIALPGIEAITMPISPPIDVPSQLSSSTSSRAISVTQSDTYCAKSYWATSAAKSERPRPIMSGHTTRYRSDKRSASTSKSRPLRVSPCTQSSTGASGGPHSA